jgi:acyl-CoA synthetase (AMP-forming)/AMP-acid ligase II
VDRAKDMIITGGANIYPAEVERVIANVEGVRMCAVVGKPDRIMGELSVAYVVPNAASLTVQSIEAACRQQLSNYKVPREFVLVDSLPVTPTGKVQKHELRKRLLEES